MKITKDYLRSLIKECMQDMGGYETVSHIAPSKTQNIDPDGYEGRMAKGNLFKAAEAASMLHDLLQDNENLEPWVEEKIAIASDSLATVADYMKYQKIRGDKERI
jgi:hypothetical protein